MPTILPPNAFDSGAALACGPDDAAAPEPQMPSSGAAADIPHKQKLLAAIEEDYRFVLDEEKFLFAIGCVPDDFAKYMAMLDALVENDKPPLFIQQQMRA